MTGTITKIALAAAVTLIGGIALQGQQSAHAGLDICKDVNIKVKNVGKKTLKVVDLDYIDQRIDRKRSENISNRQLEPGESYTWKERNLEKVKNSDIKIRVQFQRLKSNGKWKWKVHNKLSSKQKCSGENNFYIKIK